MAQLKDTIVSGNLRVTDTTLTDTLQVTTIKAPTSSGTYGPGTSGQVLKSNGTSVYWGSDSNSVTGIKGNAESSYRTGNVNLTPANIGALALSGGTMTGNITFTPVTSTSYPASSNQLYWSGSTDWAKIYYRVDASDAGKLVFDIGDDTNTRIAFAYNGTVKSYIDTDGNFSGNAANVTGTVAIANGGTGATTRLNALKNLTNENVGSSANYFLTITSSWGKGGYTSVADAKTVLGLKSAAYTESSAYLSSSTNYAGSSSAGGPATNIAIARVTKDSKVFPGANKVVFEEYTNGTSYNLPSNHYYHIMSVQGPDTKYGTQLALGMTTTAAYYRVYNNQTWSDWKSLINTNTTYSANNGVGLSGTTFYNSGVRAVSTGSANGTISVNTNGSTDDVAVKGLASAAYVTQESLLRARSSVTTDGGATGWSQIGINQYNNAYPDGVTNKIYAWGAVVSIPTANARFDLYYNHNSSRDGATTNGLQYRTGWDNDKKAWRMLLDSGNYTSYDLPRNIKHIHKANGTDGSGGWVNIARITVTEAYADQPMTFTIAQRGIMQYRIHLLFTNSGTAAATEISQFIITRDNSWTDTNNDPRAYIIKPSDGIFDLYIRKTVTWDCIFVVDFTKADENGGANYSVTWKNVHAADSAITGGTEAVKKLYLPTTTNYAGSSSVGGAATSANKLNTNAGAGDRPVYFSGGVPVQCDVPASGSWFKGVPQIGTDGVMEFGKIIDFHSTNTSTADYDLRLQYTGTATGKTVTLPGASGYVALLAKSGTSFYGMLDGDGTTSGWIRATSNGFIPSAEARFFQTATSSLGTSTWYFNHSYIQNMSANRLVLGVAKMTDGAAKGQVKFFSGNANDTTGTVTLECVNDSARTGDYTVKLPTWNGTIPVFEKLFEGASTNVSLSFSDINEYDIFLITVSNSNDTSEQVTVASLWISNVVGVHDMPLIWGGTPSSSGGACNVTSGWIQLSKSSGTTTFSVAHKSNVAQMTSSGWKITSPTYNLYIRKIFGLKAFKRT